MGLQAIYERFLQAPNNQNLANDATLQYVTTLKSFSKQDQIINHLEDQNKNIVRKKSEKVISAVEGYTSVAVIVETTLEFTDGGGAYLPGLDTFIFDRVATLPVTHFVHFDQNDKIIQIRLSWDQGDLLKQVDVIGARGKNWPVYGGKEQINMITTSSTNANKLNPAPALSPRGRNRGNNNGAERDVSPSKKYIKDPHSSLDIFNQEEQQRENYGPNAVAPRESQKPQPRDMSDIFAAGHEDYQPSAAGGSPRKDSNVNVVAPKGAGHKRFQPSEVFADYEHQEPAETKLYKTNPARYNHFDIGDHDDNDTFQYRKENAKPENMAIRPPKAGRVTQHTSSWGFDDFGTPEKAKQQPSKNERPNGRKENDSHFDFQDNGTPHMRETHTQPRKDANSQFSISDESTPAARRIIGRTKAAAGLYRDPVFGADEDDRPLAKMPNNARKDLSSQWGVGDDDNNAPQQQRPTGRSRNQQSEKGFWDF